MLQKSAISELYPIEGAHFISLYKRVKNLHLAAIFSQLAIDFKDFGVADIFAVFFEARAKNRDACADGVDLVLGKQLDELLGDEAWHHVIDEAS